ncbi:TRAP-type mannitol/chloroaromatic compound transport system, substrate-binding protein [Tistlia consotensis]|uniref:TRAP-type mannitol/chloroaromatic compound transport system, substrate-binding protein n=1 Tax=Tistlia consotensis USBA 355 TaxID=560819 RepID=A0A1Y6CFJ0_9PROT|nr:TRAP transporter substrate-binding protein [Tistlia consotensis]SMF58313.1 TRAP-type mannitol/chloroaromatic compound transport system, substrate-binding protein [Tistlia consotensis USBA 355]SNR63177.1 TRAP-type mannitol/chloroaromatic compound transport system, substrate-binding protein [Tistlia consotensis]
MESKSLNRRKFLKTGAVASAGVAASALAAPAVLAQSPRVLKMQTSWTSSDIFQDMAKQLADRIDAMSGGRLKIDLLPSGAVVKSFQVQDAVNDGVLDASHTVPAYWYGKNKAASLFGTGPVYGWDGAQMLSWINYGGGHELYTELVQKILGLNLVGWFCMPMPEQPLGWFKQRITSAAQMKGLKYRTVGLATDVMQAMGLSVTQLPGGEIVPALERGVIEAFEYNNPTSDSRFGAQDVSKVYMLGSFHQAAETFEVIFNKDVYDGLEPDLQAIVKHAVEAANTANFGIAMDNYSKDLQKLMTKDGVKVYRTPDDVLEAQLKAWDEVIGKLSGDAFFKKVLDSQKAWAERVCFYMLTNQAGYKMAYDHYWPGKLSF